MDEEILTKANELYELLKGFKEGIEGTGKANLYWGAEEAQNALGSLIECMEG